VNTSFGLRREKLRLILGRHRELMLIDIPEVMLHNLVNVPCAGVVGAGVAHLGLTRLYALT
jgi:hypothetical protein